MRAPWWMVALLAAPMLAGCLSSDDDPAPAVDDQTVPVYEPHVIVAVPDSGINPYHELYFREDRTEHPCTYIEDFPCAIQALNLTLGGDDYQAAFEADKDVWESVKPGTFYWIPQTVFVAVACEEPFEDPVVPEAPNICVLDDNGMHGTGTTSSVIMENPDALIAFKEGGSGIEAFVEADIPVDIFSVSWGYIAPLPLVGPVGDMIRDDAPIYIKANGNYPWSSVMTHWSGYPGLISVGGAYAEGKGEEAIATKQPDVVSYYCRPTAQTQETSELRESYCGTSFAAPTVAGALSKVVLDLRQMSGYTGSIDGGLVDPILGITTAQLREALNVTATYDPEPRYDNSRFTAVPLNPAAPWLQWGWGFYDANQANATVAYLTGDDAAPSDKAMAATYMGIQQQVKEVLYGSG